MSIKAIVLVVLGSAAIIAGAVHLHHHGHHAMAWLASIHGKR